MDISWLRRRMASWVSGSEVWCRGSSEFIIPDLSGEEGEYGGFQDSYARGLWEINRVSLNAPSNEVSSFDIRKRPPEVTYTFTLRRRRPREWWIENHLGHLPILPETYEESARRLLLSDGHSRCDLALRNRYSPYVGLLRWRAPDGPGSPTFFDSSTNSDTVSRVLAEQHCPVLLGLDENRILAFLRYPLKNFVQRGKYDQFVKLQEGRRAGMDFEGLRYLAGETYNPGLGVFPGRSKFPRDLLMNWMLDWAVGIMQRASLDRTRYPDGDSIAAFLYNLDNNARDVENPRLGLVVGHHAIHTDLRGDSPIGGMYPCVFCELSVMVANSSLPKNAKEKLGRKLVADRVHKLPKGERPRALLKEAWASAQKPTSQVRSKRR